MRKPRICICENKDADQLRDNHEADQRLLFFAAGIVQFFYFLNPKLSASVSCGCSARIVSGVVGNYVAAHGRMPLTCVRRVHVIILYLIVSYLFFLHPYFDPEMTKLE